MYINVCNIILLQCQNLVYKTSFHVFQMLTSVVYTCHVDMEVLVSIAQDPMRADAQSDGLVLTVQ